MLIPLMCIDFKTCEVCDYYEIITYMGRPTMWADCCIGVSYNDNVSFNWDEPFSVIIV